MNEQHQTNSTEKINGEDWCSHCKKHVEAWVVTFESSIRTDDYEKIRRCPHCNTMCLEDGLFPLGCAFFFIGLYGSVFSLPFFNYLGLAPPGNGIFICLYAVIHGVVLSSMSTWLYRLYKNRHRPTLGRSDTDRFTEGHQQ